MKRRNRSTGQPLIRLVGWESGVVAAAALSGLSASAALGAPGDLDPSFGDVGRQSELGISTTLWSVDLAPDGSLFAAGGEVDCDYYGWYYYECTDENFVSSIRSTGEIAADFLAAPLENTVVYDAARQADGRLVQVGRVELADGALRMQVSRRLADGTLDPGFGLNGKVWIDAQSTSPAAGYSVLIDAADRIVVAGTRGAQLIVVRLLPDGSLDPAFAAAGLYSSSDVLVDNAESVRIAAGPGGGYRVATNSTTATTNARRGCAVTALDASGAQDAGFGASGIVTAPALALNSQTVWCSAMAVTADGGVLLGGVQGNSSYLRRLSPTGSLDSGFDATEAILDLRSVSAMVAGNSDAVFVSGSSRSVLWGAPVLKLNSTGAFDRTYGRDGFASVAIRETRAGSHRVQDLQPGPGDTLLVGGNSFSGGGATPFVARLLGEGSPGGPGLLTLDPAPVLGTEAGQPVVATVSRIGGSTGAVAVSYTTRDMSDTANPAVGGADYTAVAGRLTWAAGDVSPREIVVPIAADAVDEPPEAFEIVLENAEGGAGLAATGIDVMIAGASYPAGLISISGSASAREGEQGVLYLTRSQYSTGRVSVTVRVAGGSASPGKDFGSSPSYSWNDVVVTWQDGQSDVRQVPLYFRRDNRGEANETATFEIVAPTGGALIDEEQSQMSVEIVNRASTGGGGGSFGGLAALLLGLAGIARRWMRRPARACERLQ